MIIGIKMNTMITGIHLNTMIMMTQVNKLLSVKIVYWTFVRPACGHRDMGTL